MRQEGRVENQGLGIDDRQHDAVSEGAGSGTALGPDVGKVIRGCLPGLDAEPDKIDDPRPTHPVQEARSRFDQHRQPEHDEQQLQRQTDSRPGDGGQPESSAAPQAVGDD